MPVIHVSGFRKTYGSTEAVDDVSFDVNAGEILSAVLPERRRLREHVVGMRRFARDQEIGRPVKHEVAGLRQLHHHRLVVQPADRVRGRASR